MLNVISIEKDRLIEVLQENRDKHITEYEQAVKDYHVIAEYAMKQMAKEARKVASEYTKRAKNIAQSADIDEWDVSTIAMSYYPLSGIQKPVSHESDYSDALEMLEFHTITDESDQNTIQLSQGDFKTFVQDNWSWKIEWDNTTKLYASGSANIGIGTTNPLQTLHISAR